MTVRKMILVSLATVAFTAGASTAFAESVGTTAKKGVRDVKDKTCEMVNGKMECAAKKLGHKMNNASDKAADKMEEVKK